jgi:hypothetical protein
MHGTHQRHVSFAVDVAHDHGLGLAQRCGADEQ